jgi:carbohydrate kinase (thermoresistant glucokinase family)
MGVAGSGKSTIAAGLAARAGARFVDADDLHARASVAKMASGTPLTDEDRWPWLAALRRALRQEQDVVVACSALRRVYRDVLRSAGGVRFVHLDVTADEAARRLASRPGHYMRAGMVASQVAALEPPAPDESDIAILPAQAPPATLVEAAERALAGLASGGATRPTLAVGSETHEISSAELSDLVERLAADEILDRKARRVLLVPPDHTRLHSRAGEITARLFTVLTTAGCDVAVLPALGTHAPMTPTSLGLLFGDDVPLDRVLEHRWREGLTPLGAISAAEVSATSGGLAQDELPVELDATVLEGWDLVVSIGQVVPHEVTGMANFTKNLVIGLGGARMIHASHFLSAVSGFESIMGRTQTPVRDLVDAAFDRLVAPRVPVLWLLTVMEDQPAGVVHRGLFVGRGRSGDSGGAAFRAAAALSRRCNVHVLPDPLDRIACWLDPAEFRSTWLANKAIYRTRMAVADGGELVVLAPGVARFGEDDELDALIRRHGYRGTAATLAAIDRDPELARSLSAAAHLIHGSSEGRFRIVYCTDPGSGGLTRDEIERVGFEWRPLADECARLGLADGAPAGDRLGGETDETALIANPALGLWTARELDDAPTR